jgi:hypothetical protein
MLWHVDGDALALFPADLCNGFLALVRARIRTHALQCEV